MNIKNPLKSAGKLSEAIKDAKKQILTTAITAAACLICVLLALIGASIFTDSAAEAVAEQNRLQNEMDLFQKSDAAFTGIQGILTPADVKIEWVGDGIDTGRWMTDEGFFWEWISPAFNYNSATEYNQAREMFISEKGLGNCLFTAQFMTYIDTESLAKINYPNKIQIDGTISDDAVTAEDEAHKGMANKADFQTWPIGRDASGDYRYLARILFGSGKSEATSSVCFTFTVRHTTGTGGRDEMQVTGFECWPPSRTGR